MIKSFTIRSQFHFQKHPNSNSINTSPKFVRLTPNLPSCLPPQYKPLRSLIDHDLKTCKVPAKNSEPINRNGHLKFNSKALITWAVSVGVVLVVLGGMEEHGGRALALGPEGPIMEEFWENVRRYALYALTVSTGVLYAVFQPIVELLKNPFSAILVIAIAVGGFYIVSQVLNAMVGVSEFSYQYYY
ncbi:hypothetical protein V2J09_012297 [Rumex salicifolius]